MVTRKERRELQREMARLAEQSRRNEQAQGGSPDLLWYESNLLWGSFEAAIAIVLMVVAATMKELRWLLILAWPFACLALWAATKGLRSSRRIKRLVVIVGAIVIAVCLYGLNLFLAVSAGKIPVGPVHTALYIDCQMDSLPIFVPQHSTAHIIRLNPKVEPHWGFYEVDNQSGKDREWPTREEAAPTRSKVDSPFMYRCIIANHGPSLLQDIRIDLSVDFHGKGTPPATLYKMTHTIIVNPLDAGSTFVVYAINQCHLFALAMLPDTAKVRVFGESDERQVPLRKHNRNEIESTMQFFPSAFLWSGVPSCL